MIIRNNLGQFVRGTKFPKWWGERISKMNTGRFRKPKLQKVCHICKKKFAVYPYRINASFCSKSCRSVYVGIVRRKNAKPVLRFGYRYIRMPEYHRAWKQQGYAKIADLTLEKKLGRKLKNNEVAHHIDGNKLNDSPTNLEVMDNLTHTRLHHFERRKPENDRICIICNKTFHKIGRKIKPKYCSKKCMAIAFTGRKKKYSS